MKHCFQFETGDLTFSKNGGSGIAYDFNDEVAAHKRGGLFGASFSYPDENYNNLPKNSINVSNTNKTDLDGSYYKRNNFTQVVPVFP